MGAFTAAESNNQIEAENSSHQALKRAWEQLSYRIRYDKSKTITARCDTKLEKKTNGLQRQNSHSRLKGVVQFATGGQVSF